MSSMGYELDQGEDGAGTVELSTGPSYSASGKLFVGGVSWSTSQAQFEDYFLQFGNISDAIIIPDKQSGKPRGFGFVTFANPIDADKVLQQQDHIIQGRKVDVKRALPACNNQIFVGGLPQSLTNDQLLNYFSEYGVLHSRIVLDRNSGRSRCFGFVTFQNEDAVEQILLQGKMLEIEGKKVEVKRVEHERAGNKYSNNVDFSGQEYYRYGSQRSSKMLQVYNYDTYGHFRNYAGLSGHGVYLIGYDYLPYLQIPLLMQDCDGGAYYGIYSGYGGTSSYGCSNMSRNVYANPASSSGPPYSTEYDGFGAFMAGKYRPHN